MLSGDIDFPRPNLLAARMDLHGAGTFPETRRVKIRNSSINVGMVANKKPLAVNQVVSNQFNQMRNFPLVLILSVSVWVSACAQSKEKQTAAMNNKGVSTGFPAAEQMVKTDAEWKRILPREQ